jgi:hypothetical protein
VTDIEPEPEAGYLAQHRGRPTSLELGLMMGHTYAFRHAGDRAKLTPIVRARTADQVKAKVDSTVTQPAGLDSPSAFWSGFAHGVAAFLLEDAQIALSASRSQGI